VADEIHNIHGPVSRPPRVAPVHRDPPRRDRREQEHPPEQEEDTVDLSGRGGEPSDNPDADTDPGPRDGGGADAAGREEHGREPPHIDLNA